MPAQYLVVLSSSYFGIAWERPTSEWGTKWLPWQRRFPSNGTNKSEIYDRIFQKRKSLHAYTSKWTHWI